MRDTFQKEIIKISKKNSKGLPGKMKLLGQAITTVVVCFLLFGPFSELLAGVDGKPLGSEIKMREVWVPFYKEPVFQGFSIFGIFVFFLI